MIIRSAILSGFEIAAKSAGLDPLAMLKAVGLDYRSLSNPDLLIPLHSVVELAEISALRSGRQDFGLQMAIARGVPDLGPLSLLLRECETVLGALETFTQELCIHAEGTFYVLDQRSNDATLSLQISARDYSRCSQIMEFGLCAAVQLLRWLVGDEWEPQFVCFAHKRPPDIKRHIQFFRCKVYYEQPLTGIVIQKEFLKRNLNASLPFLRRQAERYLRPTVRGIPEDFVYKVRYLIVEMLPKGLCTANNISGRLGIDRRTLNRRLSGAKLDYSLLVNEIRGENARYYLEGTACSIMELADLTGFFSLSAFSRWFSASFGCSPSEWRRRSQSRAEKRPVAPKLSMLVV